MARLAAIGVVAALIGYSAALDTVELVLHGGVGSIAKEAKLVDCLAWRSWEICVEERRMSPECIVFGGFVVACSSRAMLSFIVGDGNFGKMF